MWSHSLSSLQLQHHSPYLLTAGSSALYYKIKRNAGTLIWIDACLLKRNVCEFPLLTCPELILGYKI